MSLTHYYKGTIYHKRFFPKEHAFTYKHSLFQFDITDNPKSKFPFFSYNHFNVFSLREKDYLTPGPEKILQKLYNILDINKLEKPSKITLLSNPKFLSFTFNPLSLFLCFKNEEKDPYLIIAEVHNTFREKHLYLLHEKEKKNGKLYFKHQKEFHVSPFFKKEGEYQFEFSVSASIFECKIDYFYNKDLKLRAHFKGDAHTLNAKNTLKLGLCSGYYIATPMLRILYQAFKLYFLKKINVQKKPSLSSPNSFSTKKASLLQKTCMYFVLKWMKHIKIGQLSVRLPNNEYKVFGKGQTPHSHIDILDYRFFNNVAWQADLGFAKAYLSNLCEVKQLKSLFEIFLENSKIFRHKNNLFSVFGLIIAKISHIKQKNSLKNSPKNIEAHYDLGNSFFDLFLDSSKLYSSAFFDSTSTSLESAQIKKAKKLISLLNIQSKQSHILEIGSGWGYIACEIAKEYDCKVTSITLSHEQHDYVKKKIKAENLEHLVTVKIQDYRHISDKYDAIISVEMIEAVGKEYLNEYFKVCSNSLKPNGHFVIQAITIDQQYYKSYQNNKDFIQEYIFPGGHLFSKEILNSTANKFQLSEVSSEQIGSHYAQTLRCWETNFIKNIDHIKALGFDKTFIKTWLYYFNYCEAGFDNGYIDNYQIAFQKTS